MSSGGSARRRLLLTGAVALGIFAIVDRLPGYQRHGGPVLVTFGRDLGVHAGDLVVLGAIAVVVWWVLGRRPRRDGSIDPM